MDIFPAIDLKGGQCVRLTKGDFNSAIIYEADPLKMMDVFVAAGAEWLHVVDLDGAQRGEMHQSAAILKIAEHAKLKLQVGGGIRSEKTIERLFEAGVTRVVVGSLAVKNRKLVQGWLHDYGADRIVLAFDIKLTDDEPEIMTHGWQSGSQQLLWDVLEAYDDSGLKHVLCTDVSRDGMLEGANQELYQALQTRFPRLSVLASGGISGFDDLAQLQKLGLSGAVVGKAIYEGKLDLKETITRLRDAG